MREYLTAARRVFERVEANEAKTCGELLGEIEALLEGFDFELDLLVGKDCGRMEGISDASAVLVSGTPILLDLSVGRGGAWCDMTQTFFCDPEKRRVAETSLRAAEAVLHAGVTAEALYFAAEAPLVRAGYRLAHHAGHRIGSRPVEPPEFLPGNRTRLAAGDVVALETGIYDAASGLGIRLENDYLVTERGFVLL